MDIPRSSKSGHLDSHGSPYNQLTGPVRRIAVAHRLTIDRVYEPNEAYWFAPFAIYEDLADALNPLNDSEEDE